MIEKTILLSVINDPEVFHNIFDGQKYTLFDKHKIAKELINLGVDPRIQNLIFKENFEKEIKKHIKDKSSILIYLLYSSDVNDVMVNIKKLAPGCKLKYISGDDIFIVDL